MKSEIASRGHLITPAGRGILKVLNRVGSFAIDLNLHHCDCVVWNITGIPTSMELGAF